MAAVDRLNIDEPLVEEQVRKRIYLVGRHDYFPGYTPDVIYALEADLWSHLAVQVDEITEQRERAAREREQQSRVRSHRAGR